ncbi:hypothetical protein [Actinomadura sp. NPDC000929]|uniref:hypothetical protein n=1 Tax=Actinomadura sp. NPDC000929 TaxID=3154517 RepID=UPI003390C391
MPVTDHQVATLRALLKGEGEEHKRLADQLTPDEANSEYAALVAGAFIEAVERRFLINGNAAKESEVIDFVANVRQTDDEMANVIDPQIAEGLILFLLRKGEKVNADKNKVFGHQMVLLTFLVGQAQYTDAELDAFLVEARHLADQLLA